MKRARKHQRVARPLSLLLANDELKAILQQRADHPLDFLGRCIAVRPCLDVEPIAADPVRTSGEAVVRQVVGKPYKPLDRCVDRNERSAAARLRADGEDPDTFRLVDATSKVGSGDWAAGAAGPPAISKTTSGLKSKPRNGIVVSRPCPGSGVSTRIGGEKESGQVDHDPMAKSTHCEDLRRTASYECLAPTRHNPHVIHPAGNTLIRVTTCVANRAR